MNSFTESSAEIDGVETRVKTGGPSDAPVVVLLHGGAPGLSPYWGGSHLWGGVLEHLARDRRVIAPDLIGAGGSGVPGEPITVERMVRHVKAIICATAETPVHLVGHDLGAVLALWTAIEAPDWLLSLTLVTSQAAAPTGDGVENLTLMSPPQPLWTRESQAWAYEQLSYGHHHIDEQLLQASVAAAEAARRNGLCGDITPDHPLAISIMQAKSRFFSVAREDGVKVPTQLIWAKNDPLISVDHGLWLYRVIAARQRLAQFHLINRSGSFPFREQPAEFVRLLDAFHNGVA